MAMAKPLMQVGRNLSQQRIAAYVCTMGDSAVRKGKYVTGWYGMFSESRLKKDILPELSEYVQESSASYPILIVSYMLEGKTDVFIEGTRARDVRFRPRRRRTSHQNEAVVYSGTKYQLIGNLVERS